MLFKDLKFAMLALNDVIPALNLSVFSVRRAPTFAFGLSEHTAIDGRFIHADKPRDLLPFHVVENFPQKPICGFAITTRGEVKIDSMALLSTAR